MRNAKSKPQIDFRHLIAFVEVIFLNVQWPLQFNRNVCRMLDRRRRYSTGACSLPSLTSRQPPKEKQRPRVPLSVFRLAFMSMHRQPIDRTSRRSGQSKSSRQAKSLTRIVSTRTGASFVSLASQMLQKPACSSDAAWTFYAETHS